MYALVDELAAARDRRVRSPFGVIADAPAVTVAGAHKHEWSEHTLAYECASLAKCAVMTMIESDAHPHAMARGELEQRPQLVDVTCARLLNQYVLARFDGSACDLRERIMRRGDDDGRNVRAAHRVAPIVGRNATAPSFSQTARARQVGISANQRMGRRERASSPFADQATTDDRDLHRLPPHVLPRSLGTTRRSV